MRCPEGVVDVAVDALHQLLREGGVVGLLARVEAQVLQQFDPRSELGEAPAHRLHRELCGGRALWPPEMAGGDDVGAALGQPVDRRQRGPDAEVVGDRLTVEGHVEVRAHEDPLAAEVAEPLLEILQDGDRRHLRARRFGSFDPVYEMMSTSRQE